MSLRLLTIYLGLSAIKWVVSLNHFKVSSKFIVDGQSQGISSMQLYCNSRFGTLIKETREGKRKEVQEFPHRKTQEKNIGWGTG